MENTTNQENEVKQSETVTPLPNQLTTEDGQGITTEDGVPIIIEDGTEPKGAEGKVHGPEFDQAFA